MAVTTGAQPALDPHDFLAIDALLDDEEKAIRDTVRQFVREQIVPEVGESRPAIMRSVVDLPQPEGPSSTTKEPASASNVMPSSARDSAQCRVTPSSWMADILLPIRERSVGIFS